MIDILLLVLSCSLFCLGFNYATLYTPTFKEGKCNSNGTRNEVYPTDNKKEILWFVRYYGNKYLPIYLTKPIYGCLMCMGSVYGTIFYWAYVLNGDLVKINSLTFVLWLVVVTMVSGLNRLLKGIAQL